MEPKQKCCRLLESTSLSSILIFKVIEIRITIKSVMICCWWGGVKRRRFVGSGSWNICGIVNQQNVSPSDTQTQVFTFMHLYLSVYGYNGREKRTDTFHSTHLQWYSISNTKFVRGMKDFFSQNVFSVVSWGVQRRWTAIKSRSCQKIEIIRDT